MYWGRVQLKREGMCCDICSFDGGSCGRADDQWKKMAIVAITCLCMVVIFERWTKATVL